LIDVHALGVPLHDASNDEGVPQIMDACGMVRSAIGPALLPAQLPEDAMNLAVT
jgi:hypothetical protein